MKSTAGVETDAQLIGRLAGPTDTAHIRALHGRLADAATRVDLLDVAYRLHDTPVGALLLAATPAGLVRVAFVSEDHEAVLQSLADRISPRMLAAPGRLDDAARQIDEYFAGRRHAFDLALDWQLTKGFRSTVLHALGDIGYGHTVSYATIATIAGNPKAVRAVGSACATNPLPIVVPCHRVVRTDGSMGGYLGGTDAKRALLDLETAAAA